MEWAIHVETGTDTRFDDDSVMELAEALEPYYGTVSAGRGLSAQLTIEADSPVEAVIEGSTAFKDAIKRHLAQDVEIVDVEAMRWDVFEERSKQASHPDVVGVSEIAELLGVSRQRASQVTRIAAFPRPFRELAAGPVWLLPNVQRFIDSWERKPGRPRRPSR